MPLRWLVKQGLIDPNVQNILDFGSGHGADVKWLRSLKTMVEARDNLLCVGWDPVHWPWGPLPWVMDEGMYDVVLMTYVLNVILDEQDMWLAVRRAHRCVRQGGELYVTVRRDIPREGTKTQRWVELPGDWKVIRENKRFAIYCLQV